ncbi:MAG: signal peptidase I [Anaerolineae bacterium]|nr:signal peptidase I [Anaerolineae bacterium]
MLKIVLVNGQSMMPTLQSGERVLAWSPFTRRLFKRQIIVTLCYFPKQLPVDKQFNHEFHSTIMAMKRERTDLFIKRLVGLPGDTIRVPVDQLPPDTLLFVDSQAIRCGSEFLWHIPAGHVFVRGDDQQSHDSITWGPIPITQLQQIVLCRFPSLQKIP